MRKKIFLINVIKGIGSDGIILILPSTKADLKMRILNADGSEGIVNGSFSTSNKISGDVRQWCSKFYQIRVRLQSRTESNSSG